ncbi:MAG: twin-arginine translocase TatA/TatE family subunit [Chloroflexota bacterium]|nr:twin-arginine translocase TatA/TatE family subunit [Chloroflexota bacterium]
MPFGIGGGELVFVLVIVLIVFGAGKLPEVFGQLGKGVRTFRDESTPTGSQSTGDPPPVAAVTTASAEGTRHCTSCGRSVASDAKFCGNCGTPAAAA